MIKRLAAKAKVPGRKYLEYFRPVVVVWRKLTVRVRRLLAPLFVRTRRQWHKLKLKSKSKWRAYRSWPLNHQVMAANSLLIVLIVLTGTVIGIVSTRPAAPPPEPEIDMTNTITFSVDNPAEEMPGDDYQWPGKPNEPKLIRLPSLNVSGFIQKVGVDQNTQIAVPNNIFMAGWFVNSVLPGKKGLSVIDGHYDGRTGFGVFGYLDKLKAGDTVEVEMGNGTQYKYKVNTVNTYPREKAVNYIFSQSSKVSSQLNLVSCGGDYDHDAKSYKERVVVTTELISEVNL